MIGVTDRAKDVLLDLRHSVEVADPHIALRLASNTTGQLELGVDLPKEGDQVIEHRGETLLLVEENVSRGLSGAMIDYRETSDGPKLTLSRPSHQDNGLG